MFFQPGRVVLGAAALDLGRFFLYNGTYEQQARPVGCLER